MESRRKLGFGENEFIIAFTGAFIDRKGVLRLEEACKDLPVKVAYAGTGPQIPNAQNTIWSGNIEPESMPVFLSAADIFVLPTLNEGCCNAIIEALACGLPVISSEKNFNDDILDESCSIRIDTSSVEQIKKAVCDLQGDPEKRKAMSHCAVEKGRQLSLSIRAKKIYEWINDCLC